MTRNTKAKTTFVVKKLAALGIETKNRGNLEANFLVPWDKALEIARIFKFVKGKASANGFKPHPRVDLNDQMGGEN